MASQALWVTVRLSYLSLWSPSLDSCLCPLNFGLELCLESSFEHFENKCDKREILLQKTWAEILHGWANITCNSTGPTSKHRSSLSPSIICQTMIAHLNMWWSSTYDTQLKASPCFYLHSYIPWVDKKMVQAVPSLIAAEPIEIYASAIKGLDPLSM